MEQKFKPNMKRIIAVVAPIWMIVCFIIWKISYPVFYSLTKNLENLDLNSLFLILFVDVIFILGGLVAVWGLILESRTIITNQSIRRNLFFYKEEIKFTDVKNIRIASYRLEINDGKKNFYLSLIFYKNPRALLDFIKKNLPKAYQLM